jgi:hypothetical protein
MHTYLMTPDGKLMPSCKTTNKEKATLYAIDHREAFLRATLQKK